MKNTPPKTFPPSHVENEHFVLIGEKEIGCDGRRLLLRQYCVSQNPDMRPSNDISHTVVAKWALAGMPHDAVFHLGPWFRVTVIPS
ncbi:hypothetical protein AGR7C_Cc150071 [Agrobacterium deltaense Zutra 3/1]|uniref:Uncharacterized protein n=1 Tax=Agrobacterium deltaense Zutra 3/1 TaxID=1183427 RepID=A0A1S7PEK8_9HYPH|nr:hypothetical protein [Agrobacterium deltaense]CUX20247.1 hypothetical protein AGR7C_Cc150071 [Agrobacterium deltaense Zutra 3/1]